MPDLSICSNPHETFHACVDGTPLQVRSVMGHLQLRAELSHAPSPWTWKIVAHGKVGRLRTSIGLFFDQDLQPGTHDLVRSPQIRVVYNEMPSWKSVVYHSQHLQYGTLTLLTVNPVHKRVRGEFAFGISAIGFSVSEGRFDLHCD